MHIPANNVALVVTTIAGSVTLTNAYSFTSALQVKPNTAPNTKSIDVVINGLGFQSSTWNPSGLPGAHIYLVDGVYASSQAGSDRANPGVAECGNVLVLSDSELICRLNLTSRLDAAGSTAYSVAPVGRAIDVVAGSKVVTNLGGGNTFSDLDLGKTVTDPGATPKIPVNTTIVRILSTTSAVLSNAASGTGTVNVVVSAGGPLKTVSADTHTSTTVDAISPTLGSDDNGRYLFGPDIQAAGVTMSAQAGASVTISTAAGGGHSGVTLSVFPATATLPVPEGAYNLTYVSNGTVNAVANDANYVQSGLSSGSIFTVSAF